MYKYANIKKIMEAGFDPELANSIERLMKAFNFEEPDRVPLFDVVQNNGFIEHYAEEKINSENGERLLLKALSNSLDCSTEINPPANPAVFNRDGFIYKRDCWTEWLIERPFVELKGLKEYIKKNIEEIRNSPLEEAWSPSGNVSYVGSKENPKEMFFRQQKASGKCSILINEGYMGIDTAYLRAGFENFSFLYYDNPDLVSEWLQVLAEHEVKRIKYLAEPELSPICMEVAELADRNGLLFSPNFLKKEVFPRIKMINDEWHKRKTKVMFHSCGNISKIIPDLIEAGCDGLNPIPTIENMDIIKSIKAIKRDFPKVCIVGGIDADYLLEKGSHEDVGREVMRVIDAAAPGGGFILGSSIEMLPNNKPENLIIMVEICKKYGVYKK